jgi:hypothetical protein
MIDYQVLFLSFEFGINYFLFLNMFRYFMCNIYHYFMINMVEDNEKHTRCVFMSN